MTVIPRSPMRAAVEYPARRVARRLTKRSYERNPEAVLDEYEAVRRRFLGTFLGSDWTLEEFVVREADEGENPTRRPMLEVLANAVGRYHPTTVLELGAGTGRNVLYLCDALGVEGAGIELTKAGAETGRAAAERYGLPATFHHGSMTDPWDLSADVIFSVHALEQIPAARPVIDRMQARARVAVVMIEPFPDYWHGLQGFASRQRSLHLDRLRPGALEGRDLTVVRPLAIGDQLNLPTEVHLQGTA
jgi:SAM-dependent methyltransferase